MRVEYKKNCKRFHVSHLKMQKMTIDGISIMMLSALNTMYT